MKQKDITVTHTLSDGTKLDDESMKGYKVPVNEATKVFYITLALYERDKRKNKTAQAVTSGQAKGMVYMETVDLYFLGGINECQAVNHDDLPEKARYVCTIEGYDVYDGQDWEGTFYAVKFQ